MIVYETKRLLLETWEFGDFEAFAEIARDPIVMRYIADGRPWPDSRIGWFMGLQGAFQLGLGYCNWKLVHRDKGELIGFCGLAPLASADATEIGWWLKPDHWGQGYAFEAAEHVLSAAFKEHALEKVVARVYDANTRSIDLMKRLGMTYDRPLDTSDVGDVSLYSVDAISLPSTKVLSPSVASTSTKA